MTLYMIRDDCTETRTFGTLTCPDGYVCETLEDPVRPEGVKVLGDTAIPSGTYRVTITRSKRFQKMLPLIHEVPGFGGVRIHAGNSTRDTTGCVLVGLKRDATEDADLQIQHSRAAMEAVQHRIAAALAQGETVWLDITTPRVTTDATFTLSDATGFSG